MILPAIAAALALGGAPVTTKVVCQPDGLPGGAFGLTYWADRHVEFDNHICGGLLLLSVDDKLRAVIIQMNPGFNAPAWMGVGALIAIHESYHVGLNSQDEAIVECDAMRALPDFLHRYLSGYDYDQAMAWAQSYDTRLPPSYHGNC